MKTITDRYLKYVYLFLWVLLCVAVQVDAGIMKKITTTTSMDSLYTLYKKGSSYDRRYILKYIPQWSEENDYAREPDWLHASVTEELKAKNAMLVMEAVILAGRYRYEDTYTRLIELYKNVYQLFPADANRIRSAVLGTVMQFEETLAKECITVCINHTPNDVLKPFYPSLLHGVARYGDETFIPKLDEISLFVEGRLAALDKQEQPGDLIIKYKSVLHQLNRVKEDLQRRGGEDE